MRTLAPARNQSPKRSWGLVLLALGLFLMLYGLVYSTILRPYHLQWGATSVEVNQALPGDAEIHPAAVVSTRAVTIDAPPAVVWPWIVQLGQGRGGFYSFDWLENLFAADIHNADRILPEHQSFRIGDRLSYMRGGPSARVTQMAPGRYLVVEGWTWYLEPLGRAQTRLIVRYPSMPVRSVLDRAYYYLIFEQAHMVMELGMMLGIKHRAEMTPIHAHSPREAFNASR